MVTGTDGRYATAYDGTLTQLQFLQRIGSGDLQGDRIDEYVGIYEREIRRSSGFKEVTYLGKAEYNVKFEQQGSIARERQFSFPNRSAVLLGLRVWTTEVAESRLSRFQATGHPAIVSLSQAGFSQEPNIIEIFGDRLPQRVREDLEANGFWIQGSIRIWTDAKVGYHNADQVVEGSPALYIWEIDSFNDQAPHMIMAWNPPDS